MYGFCSVRTTCEIDLNWRYPSVKVQGRKKNSNACCFLSKMNNRHRCNRLIITLAILLVIKVTESRIFEQQLKNKGHDSSTDIKLQFRSGQKFPSHFEPVPLTGHQSNSVRRNSEVVSEGDHQNMGIHIFDFSNLTGQFAKVLEAVWKLAMQTLRAIYTLIFQDQAVLEEEKQKRKSVIVISWIVTATVTLLLALLIKKCFFSARSEQLPQSHKMRVRGTSRKIVTFVKELTLTHGRPSLRTRKKRTERIYERIPVGAKVFSGDNNIESKVTARFFNLLLDRLFDSPASGIILKCLESWVAALNEYAVKQFQVSSNFTRHVCHQ